MLSNEPVRGCAPRAMFHVKREVAFGALLARLTDSEISTDELVQSQ